MPVIAVIGGQWGDEGKGKIVGYLAKNADLVVRGTGGHNAGHTVYKGDLKTTLHVIPSGIVDPKTINIIGKCVVINLKLLYDEIMRLKDNDIDVTDRLIVSDRTNIILPHYCDIENVLEEIMSKGGSKIGTTGKAIGPAYMINRARFGLTFGDIQDEKRLRDKLSLICDFSRRIDPGLKIDADSLLAELLSDFEKVKKYIKIENTDAIIHDSMKKGYNILLEGAQGTMLSIEHGTYPAVTSSNSVLNGLCDGAGISAGDVDSVYIVLKAYPTRVGNGYMPTIMETDMDEAVREKGHEFGTTTGRPRRCGWFDAVAASYSIRLNRVKGGTFIALIKLDIFDGLSEVRICTDYRLPDGSKINEFPTNSRIFEQCKPVYKTLPGWTRTNGAKSYDELPTGAKEFIAAIENIIDKPVKIVSTGPKSDETIHRE